jgi:tRNA(adenine34) deaminase
MDGRYNSLAKPSWTPAPATISLVGKANCSKDTLEPMMNDLEHDHYMRRAIELAAKVPNLPFGAVIVNRHSGQIVAEGWNKSSINPTWHGEIDAINQFVLSHPGIDGTNLVLYTTAEPCPMCQGAILWTGIEMVIFGTSIRFLQKNGWRQIDILAEEVVRRSPTWRCTLIGGVLEQECNALFLAASRQGIE